MKQILHIFRKDTRGFRIEILAFLVALSLYALLYPSRWNYSALAMRSQFRNLLLPEALVPAAAWLLIARVIHAESMVGDRQWWLTRPYEWKKLLAAKALFVAAWIYVPFVAAEAAILKEGGLSPLAHFAGWFPVIAIASAYGVLPLIAIAAVTANFARMTLALFGGVVVWMGATTLASMPRGGYESNVPDEHTMWIVLVMIAGAAIAVLIQFATRKAWLARGVVVITAVLATGTGMLLTSMHESEIDRAYPAASASAASPVQLALATYGRTSSSNWAGEVIRIGPSERQDKIYIDVPIVFSGVAEGSAVQVDDVKVTLDDAASGVHWTAPWWASRTMRFLPGEHEEQVQIMLDRDQYERFKSAPTTLHLALAVTELRAGSDVTTVLSSGDFPVSGFGVCTGRWLYRFPAQPMCRSSALDPPPLTYVSTVWSKVRDSEQQRDLQDEPAFRALPPEAQQRLQNSYVPPGPITAASWAEMPYDSELFLRLLPVWPARINLYPRSIYGQLSSTRGLELAPGTPMHFVQYTVTGRTRVFLTIPNFRLPDEPR